MRELLKTMIETLYEIASELLHAECDMDLAENEWQAWLKQEDTCEDYDAWNEHNNELARVF